MDDQRRRLVDLPLSSNAFYLIKLVIDQIKWIEDILSSAIKDLPTSISVSIKLYVTAILDDSETFEEDDVSNDKIEEEKMPSPPSSQYGLRLLESPLTLLEQGRPDLNALIQDEIAADTGPISINGD